MSVFIRRFLTDPGNDILLNIESVNVLDLEPPAAIKGIGTGTAMMFGEFENGPFNFPTEIASPDDLSRIFGTLGYTYGGVVGYNPSAIARKADGSLSPEFWNGNGFVQLNGKQFARLILVRADTSIGSVQFSPQAFITGAASFKYVLAPAQTIALDLGPTGSFSTATFNATAATVTGSAGTFVMAGGDTVVLGYDNAPNFTVTFQGTDSTVAADVARINQFAGFTFATVSGGQVQLTGLIQGTAGQVRVVSGSAGVLTKLGLTAATTFGTGNVQNIAAVTPQEVATVIQAAVAGTKVEQDSQGRLRISNTTTPSTGTILVGTVTATALGFTTGQNSIASLAATVIGTAFVGGVAGTLTLGVDSLPNFTVAILSGDSLAGVITKINTAAGFTMGYSEATATQLRLIGQRLGGGGQIRISGPANLLTALGLTAGTFLAPLPLQGILPAGTVVQDATATNVLVTMQDINFTSGGVIVGAPSTAQGGTLLPINGPWPVKVRYALDDDSGAGTAGGNITVVPNAPDLVSAQCVNLAAISPALNEANIDLAYQAAMDSTLNLSSVAAQANLTWSARQSNYVRRALRLNAITASASGMFGRVATIRTPLGLDKNTAQSVNAEPGVGAYRDQRVIYTWPQARSLVPLIARRGLSGNPASTSYLAFTADGNVDMGADGFLVSIMSQLAPEENPGQLTGFTAGITSLESSTNANGLTIVDYINFKAAGICALRFDQGVAIYQSGVTSVDPNLNPGLVRISRRRMADYIQDSLSLRTKSFGKKLSTNARRNALVGEIRAFMEGLLSRENPANQRIAGFTIDAKSANTPAVLAQGLFRIRVPVRTLPSLDSIVLEVTVGEQVTVTEVLPLAA